MNLISFINLFIFSNAYIVEDIKPNNKEDTIELIKENEQNFKLISVEIVKIINSKFGLINLR